MQLYRQVREAYDDNTVRFQTLADVHQTIHGMDMSGEKDEQQIIFDYLDRDSQGVLEFGGNIGRTSMVINRLLRHPRRHVVFESDPDNARTLARNRALNGCCFTIVAAALSDRPLVQNGWNAKILDHSNFGSGNNHANNPEDDGWKIIPTMSFSDFQAQFPIPFDTLVVDCEGCIAQILLDHGDELLSSIRTIIIEHDDAANPHVPQNFVRNYLANYGFDNVVCRDLNEDVKCFFQVLRMPAKLNSDIHLPRE